MPRLVSLLLFFPVAWAIFLDIPKDSRCEDSESDYPRKPKLPRNHPSYVHDSYNNPYPNPPPRPHPPPRLRPTRTPRRGCEPGWYRTQREFGGWCMKVFAGNLDQPSSEKLCRAKGAVLSGLRTVTEINYVVAAAMAVIYPEPSGSVWIGIRRRTECMGQGLTSICNSTHSFQWTDHSATRYEGMKFQAGEPSNVPGHNQNCALLIASYSPTVYAVKTYYPGLMDDVACDTSGSSHWPPGTLAIRNRAYVCGKSTPHYG